MNNNCVMDWPCDYCKKKFIDVRSVINHELYLCEKIQNLNMILLK